jgi:hypothetical protein
MKIEIEIIEKDFNDYPITEFENAMETMGYDYSLNCDDEYIQAKFGQKMASPSPSTQHNTTEYSAETYQTFEEAQEERISGTDFHEEEENEN